jgi:hypothetical protein
MKQLNFINKYFKDFLEYSSDVILDSDLMLEDGVLHQYISSTFLNGFINYVKPMKVYVIDRYRVDSQLSNEEKNQIPIVINMCKDNYNNWENIAMFTKQEVIDKFNDGYKIYHTKLSMFDDDVLFLGETDNYYWYFWFDCDVVDCCIGRFKTKDSEDKIISLFTEYCMRVTEDKIYEFKLEWLQGWLSF